MTHAKHTTHTDALDTLGSTLDATAARDAIHLAVEPVVAGATLCAGDHVGPGLDGLYTNASDVAPLGIVDPFLMRRVRPGERFWLVVYPRQITSLRHVWSHPSFPEPPSTVVAPDESADAAASEWWLENFCNTHDCPSWEMVRRVILNPDGCKEDADGEGYGVTTWSDGDEYLTFYGQEAHCELPEEFWRHVEVATGRKFNNPPMHFSCSC
jgi:hypothetical protein